MAISRTIIIGCMIIYIFKLLAFLQIPVYAEIYIKNYLCRKWRKW